MALGFVLDKLKLHGYQATYDHGITHGMIDDDAKQLGADFKRKIKSCAFGRNATQEDQEKSLEEALGWIWSKQLLLTGEARLPHTFHEGN